MRKKLKTINLQRKKFRATFVREGKKINWKGFSETTLLFKNILDEAGNLVADHLWFSLTKSFEKLGTLVEDDVIEFEARVGEYSKGYVNRRADIDKRRKDFKLNRPTKIKRIDKGV